MAAKCTCSIYECCYLCFETAYGKDQLIKSLSKRTAEDLKTCGWKYSKSKKRWYPPTDQPTYDDPNKYINHPSHYGGDTVYEAIKVIEAWGLGFNLGNTLKYISRADKKGDRLENLKKALWYLNREIENAQKHK